MIEYEITEMPLYGTASITGSVLYYEPDTDYTGPDFITYQAIINGVPQKERRICLTITE